MGYWPPIQQKYPPSPKIFNPPPSPQLFYSPLWLEMAASAFFKHGYSQQALCSCFWSYVSPYLVTLPPVLKFLTPPPVLNSSTTPVDWKWLLLHFFHTWLLSTSLLSTSTFLKLLPLIKCCHNWFLKKLK